MCKSVWTNCYCHPTLPGAHWVTGNKQSWRCARREVVLHGGGSGRGLGKGECPIHQYSPTTFVPTLPVSFTGVCVNGDRWHQVEDCVDMLEFKGNYSLLMKAWWNGDSQPHFASSVELPGPNMCCHCSFSRTPSQQILEWDTSPHEGGLYQQQCVGHSNQPVSARWEHLWCYQHTRTAQQTHTLGTLNSAPCTSSVQW